MAVQMNRGMTSENEMKEQDMAPVYHVNAPKYGTVVPNRIFVGGITTATTEDDLNQLFSNYGKVINSKIIVDRAGISRGYGFVTFESDEEARRLQKDADNIVLKERKLNIAPAIKKQVQPVYTRGYDASSGPGSPSQYSSYIHRQNGVVSSYAYMNSLTYYPQQAAQQSAPSMTPLPSNHVEPSVYPGNYPALPQCNSPPSYQYGYPQQAPIFIPHYPFAVPQYDGCYQGELQNGYAQPGMESNNQVAFPQYFVSQHPEITYYQQPVGVPQELVYTQRTYDSSTVYFTEPKYDDSCEPSPTSPNQHSPGPPMLPALPSPSLAPISEIESKPKLRNEQETPVVSLSKVYHDQDDYQPKPRYRPHQGFKRKPPPRHENNNNNPDLTDKNIRMNRFDKSRIVGQKPTRPIVAPTNRRPNPRPTNLFQYRNQSMQVPQFPTYYASRPYMNQSQPYQRKPFQRGKLSVKSKKYRDETEPEGEDEDVCELDQLTPPITPISPKQHDITESDKKDELIRSFENLKM